MKVPKILDPAIKIFYIQGVTHYIRSFVALNCDFMDKSRNMKRLNHFILKNC